MQIVWNYGPTQQLDQDHGPGVLNWSGVVDATPPPTGGMVAATWVAVSGGRVWAARSGGRLWVAGGRAMGVMVENVIEEEVPGSGTVRLAMDFGNLKELLDGAVLDSCAVSVSGPGLTTLTPSSVLIDNDYTASALFTGGSAGEYTVTWTPTIELEDESTQVLPPRTATLILR